MKFCPARRTLTIFTEPRISGEDPTMKVLPVQPWGSTPAPPPVPKKPPVSRKPEGPWPRARISPMPPYKGVVNQGYQSGGNSPQLAEAPSFQKVGFEEGRRKREAMRRTEEVEEDMKRREEEAKRKREEDEERKMEEGGGEKENNEENFKPLCNGTSPSCECGKKAEEEAKLLRLHNVRLRQVASALASKLRASEAALGASRADADARLAALVRALLAFEAGLRREQSRIRSAMDRLEGVVRAQKAEITVLKAAGAAAGLNWEDVTRKRVSIEVDWTAGVSRGIRPASILRDVLRNQLGAAWGKREEELKKALRLEKEKEEKAGEVEEDGRIPGEGKEKTDEEDGKGEEEREEIEEDGKGARAAERVKPPLPPRPRPRLTTSNSEEQVCREERKEDCCEVTATRMVAEEVRFRDQWSGRDSEMIVVDCKADPLVGSGGGWGLNAHFEEFVLGEEPVSNNNIVQGTSRQEVVAMDDDDDEPPSTPPPPPPPSSSPPPLPDTPEISMSIMSPPPPVPAVKPRTALMKPPRKHPPPNKHQATTVSSPPLRFLLPDLLCPTPRAPDSIRDIVKPPGSPNGTSAVYLKENAMNGDVSTALRGVNGFTKGRPLGPSALQNAINPKASSDSAMEAAKGHCSYERFLEVTGLSQKSILTQHRPIPQLPASMSRPLPPPPPKHRSVLKPRDVKMRSKAARNVGWEDAITNGDGVVGVVATDTVMGATRRYWSGPYL